MSSESVPPLTTVSTPVQSSESVPPLTAVSTPVQSSESVPIFTPGLSSTLTSQDNYSTKVCMYDHTLIKCMFTYFLTKFDLFNDDSSSL